MKILFYAATTLFPLILSGCGAYPSIPGYSNTPDRASSNRAGMVGQPVTVTPGNKPSAPVLKRLPNGHYRVMRNWPVNLNGRRWIIPKGYTSNGITAPDYIKANLGDSVKSRDTWSAVFHDWLFTQPGVSRAEADRLYYEIMIAYGVPQSKAKLMFNTVSTYSLFKSRR